ncbi:hypothetical protein SRHO_G00054150 [Serrasalmus rhombeus]
MKQIAFNMRRLLCIILLLPAIKTYSPNSVLASVQFVPAGSTVKIPCDGYGDHTTARWLYRRKNENFQTIARENVRPSHAGKYSCWRETVTGKRHTVYAVTLCVFTVTAVELTDSPQNCNLYCDVDVNAMGNPVTVVADKWNISITGIMKKPKSSVICRLHSRGVETDRLHLADESTTQSGRNSTRGGQTMTRSSGDEDETQVVYSMLYVGRHQQQNVITSDNECVYSQIKV